MAATEEAWMSGTAMEREESGAHEERSGLRRRNGDTAVGKAGVVGLGRGAPVTREKAREAGVGRIRARKAAGRLETSDPRPGPEELDPDDDGAFAGSHGISQSFPVKSQRR